LLHVEVYETYRAGATFGSAYSIVPSGGPIAPVIFPRKNGQGLSCF
jgi:hypothetical protein